MFSVFMTVLRAGLGGRVIKAAGVFGTVEGAGEPLVVAVEDAGEVPGEVVGGGAAEGETAGDFELPLHQLDGAAGADAAAALHMESFHRGCSARRAKRASARVSGRWKRPLSARGWSARASRPPTR